MDLKDKLELLKKERQTRSRSRLVKDSWEEIDKDEALSTKEKLQKLISLTRMKAERPQEPKQPSFEPLKREPLQFFENPFPLHARYGKITLSSALDINGDILSCLSKDRSFEALDLSSSLFIDLETTGLSGGTGVIPFLVGLGYYRDDRFTVVQYFLGELAEEERMVQELGRFFSDMNFQSVVTFNGKAFDVPLLETRFILHRQPFSLIELPHLDFLFSARSLWGHKYESCRLYNLARDVVEADRSEDIPSAEIPWRYFQYIHTGNFELIEPILYHNQEDILSLLGIVTLGAHIFSEDDKAGLVDAMDCYGAGKVLEKAGDAEKSVQFFQKALEGKLTEEISIQAKKKLSYYFKRSEGWDKAVSLWREVASSETNSMMQLFSFRELAMYLEHKEKNYEEARRIAEEGLVLSMNTSPHYERDFSHRIERLKQKIRKQEEMKKENAVSSRAKKSNPLKKKE